MEPSPYLPTTRRFVNPVYIRVEDIREVAYMPSAERQIARVARRRRPRWPTARTRIDRDRAWEAKSAALEIVHRLPRSPARQRAYDDFRRQRGRAWSTSPPGAPWPRTHGLPASDWPAGLRDPRSAGGRRPSGAGWPSGSTSTAGCSGSPTSSSARRSARPAAPAWALGVIHDLPVGVHPRGRRRLGARRRRSPQGVDGRRAAGPVQPAGPELEPAAAAPGPAGRAGATRRTATCCARSCAMPAACGSTT